MQFSWRVGTGGSYAAAGMNIGGGDLGDRRRLVVLARRPFLPHDREQNGKRCGV